MSDWNCILSAIAQHYDSSISKHMNLAANQNKVSTRIQSVDIMRGAIMIIMALDHVRDFFHITAFSADPLDPKTTTAALFFTRWITHFCAPSFMLLSGISAYLSGQKQTLGGKSAFLVKRGIWLIFVEVAIMTFILSFDPSYNVIFLNVIWALGCSMIFLGIFIRIFPPKAILGIGLVLIFGHNLFDFIKLVPNSTVDILANVFFTAAGKFYPRGDGGSVAVLYVILPWTGIMLVGYGIGMLYHTDVAAEQRQAILLRAGIAATALFVVLRLINLYGDPVPWTAQENYLRSVFSFLNASKYPPSLLFSLMTVGPVLILLSLMDEWKSRFSDFLRVYGKVPFFYFVIHFALVHFFSAIAVLASGRYTWDQATSPDLFFKFRPFDFGYQLGWVYLIWVAIVAMLYMPSKWFTAFKGRHKKWKWLSYL